MASKPLRPCLHPGCTALVRGGYCERHRPPRVERRSEDSRRWRRWYSLPVWTDDLRPEQLAREPFCRECAAHGLRVYATDVDHVVPHDGDWSKFIDPENLQSLCHSCHGRKTAAESRAKARTKRR
ncbi:HNH endonuclease [uncultured Butyricicoccus sp.]|uniref:Putative HNH nuclease YajD n=1 Tax=Agathobaculum ammoniilyticum TaxID=2981778 RepID=A0ABT2U1U1_9FIRM|nr:HNH endonuclease [Agathobaculum ammoniilyticum]MBS6883788.1 HNH endonuclease [Clostridiaceae bacterium]MCU6788585.1 HNH endonuclease [Agathobaculum ammoniilyticum]SCI82158.1 HNH endonuclease [uncultured Butyricicoccus sp.]